MERIKIIDLPGYLNNDIISYYLVQEKELRQGQNDFFLRMKLADKTGSINANVWNNAPLFAELFGVGDVVKIKGIVKDYKGQLQITINNIKPAAEDEFELADYLATTSKNIGELGDTLFQFIDSLVDSNLKELLKNIFNPEFFPRFAKAPAAKSWHHNYIGGLLEHTVSLAVLCDFASKLYPVDRDLLITGALLHDMGKVYEYSSSHVVDFTNIGRLVGHISIADQIICSTAASINAFPEKLLIKLRHLILSHHGELEKGAVKVPQTIEAIVLHFVDNLDAQTVGVKQLIEGVKQGNAEWTEYDRMNNRYFFLG